MANYDPENPFAIYNDEGTSTSTPAATDWGPYSGGGDYSGYTTGSSTNNGASTNPSDYTQVGKNVVDSAGKIIGSLVNGQTVKDLVTSYVNGQDVSSATGMQEDLRAKATTSLTALANSLRNSSANPDLLQYVEQTQRAVLQGQMQPSQALAAVQQQSALHGIEVPAEFKAAVDSSLGQLDTVSKTGYSPIERAAIQKALDQVSTQTRGEQAAIATNQQEKGQYGTGSELVQRQMSAQSAANTAAQQGLDIQSQGLKRALDAMTAKGSLGISAGNQAFDQQKSVASAQDTINSTNAQLQQQMAEQNAQRAQQAAGINNTNAMHVQDTNLAQANLQQANDLKAAQQQFDNIQAQKTLAATVDMNAAKNAAGMWKAPYDAQLAAKTAQNTGVASQVKNATSDGGIDWGKIGTSVIGNLLSDETKKDNKKVMNDDKIENILNQLVPNSFTYKKSAQRAGAPAGAMMGIMAQDLEKSPAGATLVIDTPDGKKIDSNKALSMALAALTSMNSRIKEVEGK